MIKENVTKTNLLLASSPNKVVKINVPRVNVPYVLSPYIGATQGKNEVHLTWQNTVYEFVYEKEKVNINYFDVE